MRELSDRGAEAEAKFGNILEQADVQSEMQMEYHPQMPL